jgi:ABC-2 type transport system ATP-binding protein
MLATLAGLLAWSFWPRPPASIAIPATITVHTGPDRTAAVRLDTTYYRPAQASAAHPVPAVLLAHGFGETKDAVASDARDLAAHGYAVLAWTSEGFGRSGGQVHLDSPDWEVTDARQLVDWLAARPEILRDAPGDPRVAAVGGSYGGALALLLAGYDRRVDAVVPEITWNDLAGAFLPEATGAGPEDGVFKKAWAGLFFGGVGAPQAPAGGREAGGAATATPAAAATASCGRFAADLCQAYLSIATTGRATPGELALMSRSSPASILGRVRAPTLLIQGQADSLFPLAEADANARGLAATGTQVQVAWYAGGHDGGQGPPSDQDRVRFLTLQWLDHYLLGEGPAPGQGFTYSRIAGADAGGDDLVSLGYSTRRYPGLGGQSGTTVALSGPPQEVLNPPNGTPAAVSSLPGIGGGVAGVAGAGAGDVPGQYAVFSSAPLRSPVDVVGAPTVRVRAASPTGEAVLFLKLEDVDPHAGAILPDGLVAPVHLRGLPASIADARPITVTLPAIVHQFQAGHLLRVVAATSDQAYATPPPPTVYTVVVNGAVRLPLVRGQPIAGPGIVWRWALAGLAAALAAGLAGAVWLGRRGGAAASVKDPGRADTPLVVRDLRKEYGDGFLALSRVSFDVERGQVVGLLGPNGAGKTTALRVLLGLVQPTAGEVSLFGHRLVPGAPVLSRLGALVEGPGFLPHETGLGNLRLFWRATGRPEADARLEEALDVAGLGDAVNRRVKTYSHGMKQRLAVAQAMLGLPEVLVLDEPTDGLDPPQIVEMRRVLQRYATGGRAVLVSSHLLAEVEQTCTHVVVLHRGEVVASGPVQEVVGDAASVQFEVSDVAAAEEALRRAGAAGVVPDGDGSLVAELDGLPRSAAVAALVEAGIGVSRVVPRRRLEDAFLALVGEEPLEGRR